MIKKGGLGRGLDVLIPQNKLEQEVIPVVGVKDLVGKVIKIPLPSIRANELQPREDFDQLKLKELKDSIKEKGIIQPVLVRRKGDDYELIAGERRFRAAKELGFSDIPAIVRDVDNEEALELALIENIQRADLNSIEEAKAYRKLMEHFGLSQDDMSRKVGKDRSTVANILRLLKLPDEIQGAIRENKISYGHARALLGLKTEPEQLAVFGKVIMKKLSVREVEKIVKKANRKGGFRLKAINNKPKDALLFQYEEDLKRLFGTNVRIKEKRKGGQIEIEYYSNDDFGRILEILKAEK